MIMRPTASRSFAFPLKIGSEVVLGPNVLSNLWFTRCQDPCLPRFSTLLIE
jgi:hypothetical protein